MKGSTVLYQPAERFFASSTIIMHIILQQDAFGWSVRFVVIRPDSEDLHSDDVREACTLKVHSL